MPALPPHCFPYLHEQVSGHLVCLCTSINLHWIRMSMFSGDIVAFSVREKIMALITMLIGAAVFGYFMGAMSVMVSAASSNNTR